MSFRVPSTAAVRALVTGLELPAEFLVGCATAAYQCEGGYNFGDGPRNNWAEWESRPGNERTGPSTRFWAEPARDLDLAGSLGLNAHRLSLEWARLQPVNSRDVLHEPPPWDEAALDRYADVLAMCRARGLEPVVTLHHFTHPYWLGPDPWLSDAGVDLFVAYVEKVVPALNERLLARGLAPVRWWLTINEPNVLALASYLARWMPSGTPLDLRSPGRALHALDGLYAAHVRAYGAIHRWYESRGLPRPRVAFNNFALDFYGADRFFVDLVLARSRGISFGAPLARDLAERDRAFGDTLRDLVGHARARAPERWLMAQGLRRLGPRLFAPDRFPRLRAALEASDFARPLDVVALDYYDPTLANQLLVPAGGYEPWDWEAIPEGLHAILRANATDGLPLLIAENGMATRRPALGEGEGRHDGVSRDDFLRTHLFHTLRAMKEGVPVAGYLHWSLTDNYEWGRFSPRFGLFGVDYADESRRRLTTDASGVDAAGALSALARALVARDREALEAALVG